MDRLVQWTLILLFAFGINLIAHADPIENLSSMLPFGQIISVRTNSFGEGRVMTRLKIDGLTDNIVGIVCSGGQATMYFPNAEGDVIIYPHTGVNFTAVPTLDTPTLPLGKSAVEQLCKHPNGHYMLELVGTRRTGIRLEYRGGRSDDELSKEKPRTI